MEKRQIRILGIAAIMLVSSLTVMVGTGSATMPPGW